MASLLLLPPEICATICGEVDRAALGVLCRISPLLRDQAQRMLYHTVDLQDRNMRFLRSWCLAVTRHSHLAERVHALSLQLPSNLEPSDAQKISRALALCVNLKELTVRHEPDAPTDDSVQTWILEACTFRLTHFVNSYFNFIDEELFIGHQPDLRLLSLPFSSSFSCTDAQLPNLTAIDAPLGVVVSLPGARPLERIQIHCQRSEFLQGLSLLGRYASTLKTLTLVREGVEWGSSTVDIVEDIAQVLPALLHFGINESEKLHSFFSIEESPIRGLQLFTHIETFAFRLRRGVCFWAPTETTYNVGTHAQLATFGLAILEGCPTLRQVTVGGEPFAGHELRCTVTRVAEREDAVFDDGDAFGLDAMSKFWNP
ncbi:hypothetical protein B0H10DRAFT_1055181 [Mycena sp. CBHHK59/15]|nr:hypothetical protein B0H10DRAFT_1055181 [Mycena sp. CBHHK59/15]